MFNMKQGTVLWFNWERGFGFIKEDDSEETHFVHFSHILTDDIKKDGSPKFRKLEEGERVEFEVGLTETGRPGALNVRRLEPV